MLSPKRLIRKKLREAPLPVVKLVRLFTRHRSQKNIAVTTHYPGCTLIIDKADKDAEWSVNATNRDPDKIRTEDIEGFFLKILSDRIGQDFRIARGLNIDFRLESLCLENWRDIWAGRIQELIDDDRPLADQSTLGAFGYLQGVSKPERLRFVQLAQEFPERFEYIETDKFSGKMARFITLLQYKHRFKYIIDLPGHTYSTKIYWMMFLKRPVFYVEPNQKFEWETRLKPWEHYIPVRSDFSDLVERYDWAEAHPDRVRDISAAMFDFAMRKMPPEQVIDDFVSRVRSRGA